MLALTRLRLPLLRTLCPEGCPVMVTGTPEPFCLIPNSLAFTGGCGQVGVPSSWWRFHKLALTKLLWSLQASGLGSLIKPWAWGSQHLPGPRVEGGIGRW